MMAKETSVAIVDRQDLDRLEEIIQQNVGAFYEVGKALMEIRDKKYYRDILGFDTFEAYCKARWDMGRAHAYRLIDSARVIDAVSPIGDIHPATESQCRPLINLEPDQQRKVWQQVLETAPEGKITAARVAKTVRALVEEPEEPESPPRKILSHRGNFSDWKELKELARSVEVAAKAMGELHVDAPRKLSARLLCESLAEMFNKLALKMLE